MALDPLSTATRKTRLSLLATSCASIAATRFDVSLGKIDVFDANEAIKGDTLKYVLAGLVAYFLISFVLYLKDELSSFHLDEIQSGLADREFRFFRECLDHFKLVANEDAPDIAIRAAEIVSTVRGHFQEGVLGPELAPGLREQLAFLEQNDHLTRDDFVRRSGIVLHAAAHAAFRQITSRRSRARYRLRLLWEVVPPICIAVAAILLFAGDQVFCWFT